MFAAYRWAATKNVIYRWAATRSEVQHPRRPPLGTLLKQDPLAAHLRHIPQPPARSQLASRK
eukprot:6210146-Pleurochrysis_carterae.AAC.3